MGSKSNYLENAMLNTVLGGPQFTLPPYVYIALSTVAFNEGATGSSMDEVNQPGYARVAATNNSTTWPAASNGSKTNGVIFTFPAALNDWPAILSFYICDSATGGNVLYGGDLTVSRLLLAGDTASFGPGNIVINED